MYSPVVKAIMYGYIHHVAASAIATSPVFRRPGEWADGLFNSNIFLIGHAMLLSRLPVALPPCALASTATLFIVASLAFGCGDRVTVNDVKKGGALESCRSRNDCADGLMCIDTVCQKSDSSAVVIDGGASAVVTTLRGNAGESCQRRADCIAGLACVQQVCVEMDADAGQSEPVIRGKRGESCTASNDCENGLACIDAHCREHSSLLPFSPKECSVVQCADTAGCCANFKPTNNLSEADCTKMKENCLTSGQLGGPDGGVTADDCRLYTLSCRCATSCEDEQCVADQGQHCLVDRQCFSGANKCVNERCAQCVSDADCTVNPGSLRPYCSDNSCIECKAEDDCSIGQSCVAGSCLSGCVRDEQCGLLEACKAGECVHTGCISDRECFFLTGDDRATCTDTACLVPCEFDSECLGAFQVCADRQCKFVGCESDTECRAALQLQHRPLNALDRAVCRAVDE